MRLILAILGAAVICFLVWQLRRARRLYALELAEQERLVLEEKEKARFAQQEKEAVAIESQSKSEMLATLSREIRGHLNGIIGSADLMLDHSPAPAQREHLVRLRSSAESLHQSLNDVLDYSSIDTGAIEIAHAPFDLRQPLIEIVEQLSPLALLKNLELVLIVAPEVPVLVTGDAQRIKQVLYNLVSNAVKFTPSGRVVLRVELPPGSGALSRKGGTWLHFSVTDTGAGIPEEMQSTIFERFASTDTTTPRKYGGSGLELAISKRLVELMGGQIGARGLPDGGTEFWVVLGLEAEKTQPSPALESSDLNVIVLDDQAAPRVAASAMLARLGIDCDTTDNLAKAVALARDAREAGAKEIVLLVNDSSAAGAGSEIAHLVATEGAPASIRIILLARDVESAALAKVEFPLAAVLRKPLLRSEILLQALRRSVGSAAGRTVNSRSPFDSEGTVRDDPSHRAHVLVVDDDDISRSVSSQLLERLGCKVETASSGADAVKRARDTAYDVIFMDCQMPEMDGYATAGKILSAAGSKAPPIAALTANTSARDRERCIAAGMCDFVSKPVRKAELARVLKRWANMPVA